MNWVEVLKEFEGIIGALGGVLATLIASHYLKNAGTVRSHPKEFKYKGYENDPNGFGLQPITPEGTVTDFEIIGTILFENTSEITKAIHNIKLAFHTQSGIRYTDLQDASTVRMAAGAVRYDTVTHLNLPPKEIIALDMKVSLRNTDVDFLYGENDVYLAYEVADKKVFKIKKTKITF